MVPADWQHPKYPADHQPDYLRGRYIPLYDGGFKQRDDDWNKGYALWLDGKVELGGEVRERTPDDGPTYSQWDGERPSPEHYMPDWPEAERTHFMMYEDTSEGTPISPAFATPEELARWLADTGASPFASYTATYEQWLSTIKRGSAISMVIENGVMKSGVEFLSEHQA